MGYNIIIGNAEPFFDKDDFPFLFARWRVKTIELDNAPSFINDCTSKSNMRSPSYTVWSDFCRSTGLYELFFNAANGLISACGHPGCIGITKDDLDTVSQSLARYQSKSTLPAGFETWDYKGSPNYDYHLARLIWLEWWMRWAIENCETPAIHNS